MQKSTLYAKQSREIQNIWEYKDVTSSGSFCKITCALFLRSRALYGSFYLERRKRTVLRDK